METLKGTRRERRSCRNFKPDMITEDELQQILKSRNLCRNRYGKTVSDYYCSHKERTP